MRSQSANTKHLSFALYIQARKGQKFQQQQRAAPITPAPTDDPNRHRKRLQIPFYIVFWWSKTINAESSRSHDSNDRSHHDLSSMDISGPMTWIIPKYRMELAVILIWIYENYGGRLQRVDFIFGYILKISLGGQLCRKSRGKSYEKHKCKELAPNAKEWVVGVYGLNRGCLPLHFGREWSFGEGWRGIYIWFWNFDVLDFEMVYALHLM